MSPPQAPAGGTISAVTAHAADGSHTDPRRPGGNIAGPGGPHDHDAVIIDARDAVLLQHVDVSLVLPGTRQRSPLGVALDPDPMIALQLAGRINKTQDQSRILYLMDSDGAAAVISELLAIAGRYGPQFREDLRARVAALAEAGLDAPGGPVTE